MPLPHIEGLVSRPVALWPILDEFPVGIVVVDSERRILLVNRAFEALSGLGRNEVEGLFCCDVLRSNICVHDCPAAKGRRSKEPVSSKGNIINRNREKIFVRLTLVPLQDSGGEPVGFLEVVEDIHALEGHSQSCQNAFSFDGIIGQSVQMTELFDILPVIAQSDSSVLITGETGTGKDLVAEVIHQASNRARGPFIKVNCGALPEALLESELFGHKKGAFTGAIADKPGRFRLAHGGTLYLTEIGDLPLLLQVKLLTFLDDKVVYPLGSTKGFQADVRVIAATHRDLEQMVQEGLFREDLLFRLNVVRLYLPALRERGEDVSLLMDHYRRVFRSRLGKQIKGFSSEARRVLLDYAFPGNVRELKNILEYSANICQAEEICPEHLPAYLTQPKKLQQRRDDGFGTSSLLLARHQEYAEPGGLPDIERRLIIDALIRAKGRKNKAAALLGWGRSTLWRKMKEHQLET